MRSLCLLLACLAFAGCGDSTTDSGTLFGSLSGVVRDASSEAPLAGALVVVADEEGQSRGDGRFTIENIPAGPRQLTVTLDGYQTETMAVTIRAADTEDVTVELTPIP